MNDEIAPDFVNFHPVTGKPLCPVCGGPATAEYVDIGVGEQRVSPYSCHTCEWVEPAGEDFLEEGYEELF